MRAGALCSCGRDVALGRALTVSAVLPSHPPPHLGFEETTPKTSEYNTIGERSARETPTRPTLAAASVTSDVKWPDEKVLLSPQDVYGQ